MRTVFIPGVPVPKGRPRFNRHSGHTYTPEATRQWEEGAARVIRAAGLEPVPEGALWVAVSAVFPRPARRPDWISREVWESGDAVPKTTKPDADNLLKAAMDALQMGAGLEDARFTRITASKWIAGVGRPVGLWLSWGVV